MRLVILDDYELASEWAAKYICNRIIQFKPSATRYFTLGLPTGEFLSLDPSCCGHMLLVSVVLGFREYSFWLLSEVNPVPQKWRYIIQIRENL